MLIGMGWSRGDEWPWAWDGRGHVLVVSMGGPPTCNLAWAMSRATTIVPERARRVLIGYPESCCRIASIGWSRSTCTTPYPWACHGHGPVSAMLEATHLGPAKCKHCKHMPMPLKLAHRECQCYLNLPLARMTD